VASRDTFWLRVLRGTALRQVGEVVRKSHQAAKHPSSLSAGHGLDRSLVFQNPSAEFGRLGAIQPELLYDLLPGVRERTDPAVRIDPKVSGKDFAARITKYVIQFE